MQQLRGIIVLAGGSGFIGTALQDALVNNGWGIILLKRKKDASQTDIYPIPTFETPVVEAFWNPESFSIDSKILRGIKGVICLNGLPIDRFPWTKKYRKELVKSRIKSVTTLNMGVEKLPPASRPEIFISASAIGYYGDKNNELLYETSDVGNDFLARLCMQWEIAANKSLINRIITLRTGLVIAENGGLLKKLTPLFKFRLGTALGTGKQWMSPIGLEDYVRAVLFLLETNIDGPVNLTCPNPVTNNEVTRVMADKYKKSWLPKVPVSIIKFLLGEAAALFLNSQRVIPQKLLQAGFYFKAPNFIDQIGNKLSYSEENK
ncbi:TIGR01777 family oxidoreductase [Actinomycetaceae bacterium TAE3-ERU4]|nr:TIGR01777 family oxidoreductase [Actinomycetaceae bacterium TAE3-ERU4]